ncbi:MAG: GNAT family N-acetyltransferase [Candidatus Hodarchaeales archaeon]|jgi:predicted GNAT family acetyltransferase
MNVNFHNDLVEFNDYVLPFLINHESENNLLIGILNTLKRDFHSYSKGENPYFISVEEENDLKLVSIRTPPFNQLISYTDNLDTLDILVEVLIEKQMDIPGVLGFKTGALRFAQLWEEKTDQKYRLETHERIYRLEKVNPETIGGNDFELATVDEKEIILRMGKEFLFEVLPEGSTETAHIESSQRRLEQALQNKMVYVLKVNGEIVSMVKRAHVTPNGQTVNAVYTPPNERKKGYATEAVAKLSQLILTEGKKFCFLFTDLANPTSNKIYQTIGYRPVIDMDLYRFQSRK